MRRLSGQAKGLRRRLSERPFVVLDGGLATTLEARGHDLDGALWSARLVREDPAAVRAVHREFARAGADCLVTASYQATVEGLQAIGASPGEALDLLRRTVELAAAAAGDAAAAGEVAERPLVAASIGPYGAFLADGSEYTGDYGLDRAALRAFHQPRWEALASSCDLLACETLPSRLEAEVLLELLAQTPEAGAWFAFSCRDGHSIADGTPLAECAALCAESDQVIAVGVNCTAPEFIPPLIDAARTAAPRLPVVVYPNSGETWDSVAKAWRGDAAPWSERVGPWWRAGARMIGGCCRTGPDDIRAVRAALARAAESP